jgi:hypothetical protein
MRRKMIAVTEPLSYERIHRSHPVTLPHDARYLAG